MHRRAERDAADIAAVFTAYTERKRARGMLDYDDLLLYWRALVTASPAADQVAAVAKGLIAAGLEPQSLQAEVHVLDDTSFTNKLEAVRAYRTQVVALEREAPLDQLRWEITWTR